jgi:hypothetical protein
MGKRKCLGVFRSLPGKRTNRLRSCRQGFYSPECVEGTFSEVELPLYGVLRSSLVESSSRPQQ